MSLVDYREPIAIQNDFHPVQIRTILSFVFLENVAKSSFEFRYNMHLSDSDLMRKILLAELAVTSSEKHKIIFLIIYRINR